MRRITARLLHPPGLVQVSRQSCAPWTQRTNRARAGGRPSSTTRGSGRDQAPELVAARHYGRVSPEPLQVVVLTLFLVEDVDHDVGEIEQDPAGLTLALAPHRPGALLTAGALDLVGDRADLAIVRP